MALMDHTPKSRPNWRSLTALAAGILLFVFLATLMIWVGSLVTATL
jgi:hypothetical protein